MSLPLRAGIPPRFVLRSFPQSSYNWRVLSRTGVLVRCMKPFEDLKNGLALLRSKPDPVVRYANDPFVAALFGRYVNPRRPVRISELDGVPEKVLKEPDHLASIQLDIRERIMSDHGASLFDAGTQQRYSSLNIFIEVDGRRPTRLITQLGIFQKV